MIDVLKKKCYNRLINQQETKMFNEIKNQIIEAIANILASVL